MCNLLKNDGALFFSPAHTLYSRHRKAQGGGCVTIPCDAAGWLFCGISAGVKMSLDSISWWHLLGIDDRVDDRALHAVEHFGIVSSHWRWAWSTTSENNGPTAARSSSVRSSAVVTSQSTSSGLTSPEVTSSRVTSLATASPVVSSSVPAFPAYDEFSQSEWRSKNLSLKTSLKRKLPCNTEDWGWFLCL